MHTRNIKGISIAILPYTICDIYEHYYIYIIGVNVHEYMRKEMMGKWIALLTCIINLKGNNTSATHKNIIPPYVSFYIVLENMLLENH